MTQGELIYCPNCETAGKKEVLGSVYRGTFRVLRFHRGSTVIQSEQFSVYCGVCGEEVFYRNNLTQQNEKSSFSDRDERVHRQALVGSAIQGRV